MTTTAMTIPAPSDPRSRYWLQPRPDVIRLATRPDGSLEARMSATAAAMLSTLKFEHDHGRAVWAGKTWKVLATSPFTHPQRYRLYWFDEACVKRSAAIIIIDNPRS